MTLALMAIDKEVLLGYCHGLVLFVAYSLWASIGLY